MTSLPGSSRRDFVRYLGAGIAAATLTPRPSPAQPAAAGKLDDEQMGDFAFDKANIAKTELGEGITVLSGPGGNITVITGANGSAAVIDSGIPPRSADVIKAVTAVAGGKLPGTLIDTHWHFDHAGGNEAFAAAGTPTIIAHDRCLARLSSAQKIDFFGMEFPPAPEAARPTVAFADRTAVRLNGGHALALSAMPPAHTDGDVYVRIPRGDVLVTGDLFSNGAYPFIDYSSGGSIDGMISSAEALLKIAGPDTKIVPGHGPVAGRKELEGFRDMLVEVRSRLATLAGKGMTLDEAVAARPLQDFNGTWGKLYFHGTQFTRINYPYLLKRAGR